MDQKRRNGTKITITIAAMIMGRRLASVILDLRKKSYILQVKLQMLTKNSDALDVFFLNNHPLKSVNNSNCCSGLQDEEVYGNASLLNRLDTSCYQHLSSPETS